MHKPIEDILKGLNNKSYVAWEALYSRYFSALCSYSFGIVQDEDVAKDVVQDMLMKMWQSSVQFETQNEFVAYLYKSVYNNSVLYLRNSGNRIGILNTIYKEDSYFREMELESDPEFITGVVSEEVIRELHLSIAELPTERQEVIKLSIEGHTGTEIAQLLGVSINTVKTQKYRGYRFIKAKLKTFFTVLLVILTIG